MPGQKEPEDAPRTPYYTLEQVRASRRHRLKLADTGTVMQVARHDIPEDLWLAFLGKVVNLTSLVLENPGAGVAASCLCMRCARRQGTHATQRSAGPLVQPIIDAAGTDISHWFDAKTGDVRHVSAAHTGRLAHARIRTRAQPCNAHPHAHRSADPSGARSSQVRKHIDPESGLEVYYTRTLPIGRGVQRDTTLVLFRILQP
jgi:hypothetical protein